MASPHVVCQSEEEIQKIVKNIELRDSVTFMRQRSRKTVNFSELQDTGKYNIRFKDVGHPESKGALIECDGTPFIILNSEVLLCHQGPVRKKKKTVARDHTYSASTRQIIQNTKKQDCPASVRIRRVVKFPDYKAQCGTEIESGGTAGRDIDGQTLIKLGRQLDKPLLTILGKAISNLHQCTEWTQWTECDESRANFFGIRNRTRACGLEEATNGQTRKTETDLSICEGNKEGNGKVSCPSDYNMTTNGFCIKLYVTRKNHNEAETTCQKDGGFLINIDSDLKYADVKSILKGFAVANINIGGRRKDSVSQWEYKYGSGSGYFKWYSGYPMADNSRQCLAFESLLWWNLSCGSAYPFLCEIPF